MITMITMIPMMFTAITSVGPNPLGPPPSQQVENPRPMLSNAFQKKPDPNRIRIDKRAFLPPCHFYGPG